jgi:hypothetical protein
MKRSYTLLLILWACIITSAKAQTWTALGSGIQGLVSSMVVYNGNLYVGGEFTMAGSVTVANIAEWNGTTWLPLGTGITGTNSEVFSLAVYNNELYAGGEFTQAGGASVNNIAKWNGSSWSDVNGGVTSQYGEVTAMAAYNNRLIVAGNFNLADTAPVQNIAAWDGTNWASLDTTSLWTPTGMVNCMYVWNGALYCGGNGFASAPDSPGVSIASWNDTVWKILQDSLINKASEVGAFTSYDGNLYVGGLFYGTGATDSLVYQIAERTGSGWQGVGYCRDSAWAGSLGTFSLASYSGSLFAGGYFGAVNGAVDTNLSVYNGTTWVNPHAPQTTLPAAYYAMCEWNGSLYLAGIFETELNGAYDAENIVQYNSGTNGIREIASEHKLRLYPNPTNGRLIVENLIPGTQLTVYDLLGQTVIRMATTNNKEIVDVSRLSPGMYFVNGAKFIKE